jgi:hypothetical protein
MFKKPKNPINPKITPFLKSSLEIVILYILSLFLRGKIGYLDILIYFYVKERELKTKLN